jgi:hypothetical protein
MHGLRMWNRSHRRASKKEDEGGVEISRRQRGFYVRCYNILPTTSIIGRYWHVGQKGGKKIPPCLPFCTLFHTCPSNEGIMVIVGALLRGIWFWLWLWIWLQVSCIRWVHGREYHWWFSFATCIDLMFTWATKSNMHPHGYLPAS